MKAALTDFFDRTWVPTRPRHHVILTINRSAAVRAGVGPFCTPE